VKFGRLAATSSMRAALLVSCFACSNAFYNLKPLSDWTYEDFVMMRADGITPLWKKDPNAPPPPPITDEHVAFRAKDDREKRVLYKRFIEDARADMRKRRAQKDARTLSTRFAEVVRMQTSLGVPVWCCLCLVLVFLVGGSGVLLHCFSDAPASGEKADIKRD
jgi:hypothetical protein